MRVSVEVSRLLIADSVMPFPVYQFGCCTLAMLVVWICDIYSSAVIAPVSRTKALARAGHARYIYLCAPAGPKRQLTQRMGVCAHLMLLE